MNLCIKYPDFSLIKQYWDVQNDYLRESNAILKVKVSIYYTFTEKYQVSDSGRSHDHRKGFHLLDK